MSRRLLIAANWKMHTIPTGALASESPYRSHANVDTMVFPTFLDIHTCIDAKLITGAQCGHFEERGAHTGDISMQMIAAAGCHNVLCGHSERRQHHHEDDENVSEQVITALECNLHPVVCIGETLQQREAGEEKAVIKRQLELIPLESDITIAYEPVWAIGTGKTATPDQAQEMHSFIRSLLPDDQKDNLRILYGGSMKPENAEDLLEQPDIDGGLIGGASLEPEKFAKIIEIAGNLSK